jgi:hypothetical protein
MKAWLADMPHHPILCLVFSGWVCNAANFPPNSSGRRHLAICHLSVRSMPAKFIGFWHLTLLFGLFFNFLYLSIFLPSWSSSFSFTIHS